DYAGKRNEKAHLDRGVGQPLRPRKTMNDSADLPPANIRPTFAQDLDRIVLGLAGVDDRRQTAVERQFQLPAKGLSLSLPRAMVVMIIQPDLSPADDFLMPAHGKELLFESLFVQTRLVRVQPDRGVNERVFLGQSQTYVQRA